MFVKITCTECGDEMVFDSFKQLEDEMKAIGDEYGVYDLSLYECLSCRADGHGVDMDDDELWDFSPEQKQGLT